MGVLFTPQESGVLCRLLVESATDMVLKTDRKGFILHAAPAIEHLGFPAAGELIGPHLLDLIHPSCADAIKQRHDAVLAGQSIAGWIEFRARGTGRRERWFEIQMRGVADGQGNASCAISVVRSIDERRSLERELFVASVTDPLTGLTNRPAFVQMLQYVIDERIDGCLAMFDIDQFKAFNLRHGQSIGDEVLVVFAELVRTLMRSEDIISRIGGERLGVLLPGASPAEAEAICQRIVGTLAEISESVGSQGIPITACAAVARIGHSLDDTIGRAELALTFAKGSGRSRLAVDNRSNWPWTDTQRRARLG